MFSIGSVSGAERFAYLWCDEYTPCARVNAYGQIDALYYGQGEISAAAPYQRYYARGHLGSVRAMMDAQGEVIGRQDYSAYGRAVAQSGLMPSVGYAGMWQHHDSGINLTWYRGYQPAAGRWLSRDPIEEEGGLNLYGYVGGAPTNYIDPTGEIGLPGAAIGAAFELGLQAFNKYRAGCDLLDIASYNWYDVGVAAAVGAVAPGWLAVGKNTLNSGRAISTLSRQLGQAKSANRAAKIDGRIKAHASKIGDELAWQGGLQGAKYIGKQVTDAGGSNDCNCRK